MAHFADDSMRARFPKKEKMKRTPIKHYECRRCGGSHPFNMYCPNVRDPPVIPGECRSCGTTTHEHANDCQYVALTALTAKPRTIDMLTVLNGC